jgi:hypothetical protein
MKKILIPFVIILISLFLSGCIEIQTKVTINNDGSGTLEETVLMSNEMVQMVNEFITGFASDTTQPDEFKLYKEEDLKKRESELGEGVKLVSGTEIKTESKEGYKVIYSFEDLNKLKIDQSPASRVPDDASGVEAEEKNYITFSFNKGNTSEIKINMPLTQKDEEENEIETEVDAEEDSTKQSDLSEMKFLLKDLSINMVVNVNGEIVETNADHLNGSEVTLFKLNFGELLDNPQKLEELQKSNYNFKELKEIMKNIPGIKIETNDPVVIKFR